MSNITLEEVVEEAKALPLDEQAQLRELLNTMLGLLLMGGLLSILEKAHSLLPDQQRQLRDALNRAALETAEPIAKTSYAHTVKGKYAHLLTSSDAFASRKAQEIALEDRRRAS